MFIAMEKLNKYESAGNRSYGNEMFQYAALKIYAKENNCEVQIPANWIGRELFEGCDDPVIGTSPRPHTHMADNHTTPIWEMDGEFKPNCDVYGYFQYHTSKYAPYKEFFRNLFRPKQKLLDHMPEIPTDRPLICIHIRRGDYCQPPNRVAPNKWYTDWLDKHLERLGNPVIYLCSDDMESVLPDFQKYKPMMSKPNNEAMAMFTDHWVMQHADVILASNSTFSFTAAMLNEKKVREFWRPNYQYEKLEGFNPWDSDPISPFPHHVENVVRLHLGCGSQRLPGYINIDCKKTKASDLVCDIRVLPYSDDSVDLIESYHVFEHIPVCLHANVYPAYGNKYETLIRVLEEWRRVLKTGGKLVIELPDLDEAILQYSRTSDETEKESLLIAIYGSYRNGDDTDTHKWGANETRLTYMLQEAGFIDIKFTEPQDYHAKYTPSIRVEAIK